MILHYWIQAREVIHLYWIERDICNISALLHYKNIWLIDNIRAKFWINEAKEEMIDTSMIDINLHATSKTDIYIYKNFKYFINFLYSLLFIYFLFSILFFLKIDRFYTELYL